MTTATTPAGAQPAESTTATPAPGQETGRAQGHDLGPNGEELQQQEPAQQPAQQPQAEPAPAEEDVDAQELDRLRKLVQEEDAAGAGQQQQPAPADPTSGQPPAQQQPAAAPGQQKPPPVVPVAALSAERQRRAQAEADAQEAARAAEYWRGVAEGRSQGQQQPATGQPGSPAQPQPTQSTPQQQIATLRQQQLDLANKFDAGELTMAEYQKQNADIEDRIFGARQLMVSASSQKPGNTEREPSLYIQRETAKLEQAHPYTSLITEQRHWDILKVEALAQLKDDPEFSATPPGEFKDFLLRERMAILTDTYGPIWTGKQVQIPPKQQTAQTNGQQSPTTQPGAAPTAQQRLAKMQQAAAAPPDINRLGTVPGAGGIPSDEQVAAMSEEELDALPPATRQAIRARMADSFG